MSWKFPWKRPEAAPETKTPLREAAGVTIDADEDEWRRLGGRDRDMNPITQARMRELAAGLWESNRLANRLVELPLAYLLAEGVTVTADDPDAAGWLREFWTDPINRLDRKLEAKMRALALFGEQLWPVFVNEVSGACRIGYADPDLIEKVVTDPENGEQPIVVVVRSGNGRRRLYRVIVADGDEDDLFPAGSGGRKLRDACERDAFYFRVNDLPNGRRGRSDLASAVDWCDAYETFLFGELERAAAARSTVWDVTLKGATKEQVEERSRTIQAPRPLGMRVHNDSEVWETKSPELGAYDADIGARLFRTHVLGGSTIPEHWFGSGGDVNRATAGEMGEPAEKVLTLRQRWWIGALTDVCRHALKCRLEALGRDMTAFAADPAWAPRVAFPELTAKDTTKYATAIGQLAAAVGSLLDRKLITEETALALIASIAGRLGVEIDAKTELERARAAADDQAAADAFSGET